MEREDEIIPRLYVSRCLEFDHCRYDGSIIGSRIVKKLIDHADISHDCPEMGIGLGVPRSPVKVYEDDQGYHLYQTSSDMDYTDKMVKFVDKLLERAGDVDGFILKAKSPSCGLGDVKIYSSKEKGSKKRMGSGFLGMEVKTRYRGLVIETEKRLLDERIRDHFLTGLYTLARFRKVREEGKARDLIEFHSRNKFLLMAYDQDMMREMGRIVSKQKSLGIDDAKKKYGSFLSEILSRGASYKDHINVLMHCFGYVSDKLERAEKDFFLDSLDLYRDDRTPLIALKSLLRSWITRFDVSYLEEQYYFKPYPIELVEKVDGKRDRELWK